MTPHNHRTKVPGCYRCELGEDEVRQCGATGTTEGGWQGFCFLPAGHDGPHMDVGI